MASRGRSSWPVLLSGLLVVALLVTLVVQALLREEPASQAAAADLPMPVPVVTFLGDSWTVGQGATADRGYAPLTAEELGWRYHLLGIRGTGYLTPVAPYRDRIDEAAASGADVIVVQGSLNDRTNDLTALPAAARDTLRGLRAAADPATEILVLGASYTPGGAEATIDVINEAVGSAAAEVGLPFVDPTDGRWPDPAEPALWADPDHPGDAGYRVIAARLAPVLRATLQP